MAVTLRSSQHNMALVSAGPLGASVINNKVSLIVAGVLAVAQGTNKAVS